jgi:hypothetical protein
MADAWDADFAARSPLFEPLDTCARHLRSSFWPTLGELHRLLAMREPPLVSRGAAPLKIVPQAPRTRRLEDHYEVRIFRHGEIQVRAQNWHDLFNVLVWLTFPRSKAALNERHYHALLEERRAGMGNRGPVRDALTLFDEGGLIVVSRHHELLQMIEAFAWKELFWHNRVRVMADMRFYVFGHALYEKALRPFAGITGRAAGFVVGQDFFEAPLPDQIDRIDRMLAERLLDPRAFATTRELMPLPVLGVPGWCPDNEREAYYEDSRQFRRGRRRHAAIE